MSEEEKKAKTAEPVSDAQAIMDAAPNPAEAKAAEGEGSGEAKVKKSKAAKTIPAGIAHVLASFNNTAVSITDVRGNLISWCTAGRAGFKGSRKSTAFAGTTVAQEAARQAIAKGMHEVEIRVQGVGAGRESAVRAIASAGMAVTVIKDVTPVAHNGCRQRKRRRV
ncbi:MAG: 30S ribosomal protein S11 [Kiritimatiellaeota bacterium]|nr:30S ribosomal protein S11 [Kiritimatiellota bacterium]